MFAEREKKIIKTRVAEAFGYAADVSSWGDCEVWVELNDEDERRFTISNYDDANGRYGIDLKDNEFSPSEIDDIASIIKALARKEG